MPGTAADLTTPPVTGAPAQASAKTASPIEGPDAGKAAKALASRRESTTLDKAKQGTSGGTKAQLKEFVEDDRHFSLVRNFRLADIVTLGNGFCGSLSLFSSAQYLATNDVTYLWYALSYPLLGMIFDIFDGKVARWRNESSMLGQELDSLADSISFGVAPAVAAWTLGLRTIPDTLILTTYICSGIARLARFNATVALVPKDATGKSKYFEGLPIPSSLFICAAMAISLKNGYYVTAGGKGPGLPFGLIEPLASVGIELHWASLVFAGWGMMMISKTLRRSEPVTSSRRSFSAGRSSLPGLFVPSPTDPLKQFREEVAKKRFIGNLRDFDRLPAILASHGAPSGQKTPDESAIYVEEENVRSRLEGVAKQLMADEEAFLKQESELYYRELETRNADFESDINLLARKVYNLYDLILDCDGGTGSVRGDNEILAVARRAFELDKLLLKQHLFHEYLPRNEDSGSTHHIGESSTRDEKSILHALQRATDETMSFALNDGERHSCRDHPGSKCQGCFDHGEHLYNSANDRLHQEVLRLDLYRTHSIRTQNLRNDPDPLRKNAQYYFVAFACKIVELRRNQIRHEVHKGVQTEQLRRSVVLFDRLRKAFDWHPPRTLQEARALYEDVYDRVESTNNLSSENVTREYDDLRRKYIATHHPAPSQEREERQSPVDGTPTSTGSDPTPPPSPFPMRQWSKALAEEQALQERVDEWHGGGSHPTERDSRDRSKSPSSASNPTRQRRASPPLTKSPQDSPRSGAPPPANGFGRLKKHVGLALRVTIDTVTKPKQWSPIQRASSSSKSPEGRSPTSSSSISPPDSRVSPAASKRDVPMLPPLPFQSDGSGSPTQKVSKPSIPGSSHSGSDDGHTKRGRSPIKGRGFHRERGVHWAQSRSQERHRSGSRQPPVVLAPNPFV
ncbi:hypothetical protein JCM16303_000736 [Sporobolomyces ruberrimus]